MNLLLFSLSAVAGAGAGASAPGERRRNLLRQGGRTLQDSLSCISDGQATTLAECCPDGADPNDGACVLLTCLNVTDLSMREHCDNCGQVMAACPQAEQFDAVVAGIKDACEWVEECCWKVDDPEPNDKFDKCIAKAIRDEELVVPNFAALLGGMDLGAVGAPPSVSTTVAAAASEDETTAPVADDPPLDETTVASAAIWAMVVSTTLAADTSEGETTAPVTDDPPSDETTVASTATAEQGEETTATAAMVTDISTAAVLPSLSCISDGQATTLADCCPDGADPNDGLCVLLTCLNVTDLSMRENCDNCGQVMAACPQVAALESSIGGIEDACEWIDDCCWKVDDPEPNDKFDKCMAKGIKDEKLEVPDFMSLLGSMGLGTVVGADSSETTVVAATGVTSEATVAGSTGATEPAITGASVVALATITSEAPSDISAATDATKAATAPATEAATAGTPGATVAATDSTPAAAIQTTESPVAPSEAAEDSAASTAAATAAATEAAKATSAPPQDSSTGARPGGTPDASTGADAVAEPVGDSAAGGRSIAALACLFAPLLLPAFMV